MGQGPLTTQKKKQDSAVYRAVELRLGLLSKPEQAAFVFLLVTILGGTGKTGVQEDSAVGDTKVQTP